MPFFLPSRLVDFQYFGGGEPDEEYNNIAKPYQQDIDFAFFAVNFGYSKKDYYDLTQREKAFIYKAWEDKTVIDTTNIYNAVYTATYNLNKKKNKKMLKLFKKKSVQKADIDVVRDNLATIKEVEKKEGTSWVDLIYKKNGIKRKKRKRGGA